MSNKPEHSGGFDQGVWGELLAELLAKNKGVAGKVNELESILRSHCERLKAKGCTDEDVRQILLSVTDWSYELINSCADATIEVVNEYELDIDCRTNLTSAPTARQDEYLKELKAKYSTVSGCQWGSGDDSPG